MTCCFCSFVHFWTTKCWAESEKCRADVIRSLSSSLYTAYAHKLVLRHLLKLWITDQTVRHHGLFFFSSPSSEMFHHMNQGINVINGTETDLEGDVRLKCCILLYFTSCEHKKLLFNGWETDAFASAFEIPKHAISQGVETPPIDGLFDSPERRHFCLFHLTCRAESECSLLQILFFKIKEFAVTFWRIPVSRSKEEGEWRSDNYRESFHVYRSQQSVD